MVQSAKQHWVSTTPGLITACLIACFLWGSAFPSIKVGYALFDIQAGQTARIITFAGMRFTLAGLMVIVCMSAAHRRPFVPSKSAWSQIGWLALFQTVLQYFFFYLGLSKAAGVTSSILEGSSTFITVLGSCLIFRSENLSTKKLAGCLIGFAGVCIVSLKGNTRGAQFSLSGEGLVLLSTLAAATSSNLIKTFSQQSDPVLLSAWQFVVGGFVLWVVGMLSSGPLIPPAQTAFQAWAILGYLAFISAGAYSLWSLALAHNSVSRVAIFGFMNPVFGVILSAIVLGEASKLNVGTTLVSLALVSLGIIVVETPKRGVKHDSVHI